MTASIVLAGALGIVGSQAPTPSAIELSSARGLSFIAEAQRSDGSFGGTSYQVAAQGLAGLAFLSRGHMPKHGKYARTLRLGLRKLLKYQNTYGYFDDRASRMYGHGFATLYLAQVLGMWGDPQEEKKIREGLQKAIRLIESCQGPLGGWDYDPRPGGTSDCSITVCQTMALRAARNIGLKVSKTVIDRAFSYVKNAQTDGGGFKYRIGGSGAERVLMRVTLGCSAAGVCILNGLGEYDSPRVKRGLVYLRRNYPTPFALTPFYYYTHYYAAQAFYGTRGPDWDQYYRYITTVLLDRQRGDGSWRAERGGAIQGTAMAVFILNVPRAVLPIIQK